MWQQAIGFTNPLNPTLTTTPASRQNTAAEQNPAKPVAETKSAMWRETRDVVVRRFEIVFQLDILLILKLAAVIYLFNQDGSRQRLVVLVIFCHHYLLDHQFVGNLLGIYRGRTSLEFTSEVPTKCSSELSSENSEEMNPRKIPRNKGPSVYSEEHVPRYQTGALASFIRWLSQAAAISLNQDAVPDEEGQENEAGDGNRANANENVGAGEQGNQWWGIVKEIQMIVFGFITSLLPGFHNID
ncbi:hypothetical protein DY000_02045609 [Brassica cretica]|uniref:Uncharacterized protein n=1 Tax=Brassica cretica TaxID=69181 RepID=A0ABQ7ETP3_BRACR|nr:hypothetical protein DY000_02045609 [Brassica cretica]